MNLHKQSWWTNEFLELKNNAKKSRSIFQNDPSDDKSHQRNIDKKQFRRVQRRNLFLYEKSKAKNIVNLDNNY